MLLLDIRKAIRRGELFHGEQYFQTWARANLRIAIAWLAYRDIKQPICGIGGSIGRSVSEQLESGIMSSLIENPGAPLEMTGGSRFVRACLRRPVDRPPVWFLRQAGRYMAEYREVRKHHTLVEICKRPELAAEVTITAAEKLGVDAAIIFADLLLPLEPMGLDFEFVAGEGPLVHQPLRTAEAIDKLRVDRTGQLEYVAAAIEKVAGHFGDAKGMIGFCGSPFTLASYMIEGGSSRNYVFTKQMMYGEPYAWQKLLDKLVTVLVAYCKQQVDAGADVIQIFDSWVGSLGVEDYRDYVLPVTTRLVRAVQGLGVPVIYFGVETASLLPAMRETGADVIGLDWRTPLDEGWKALGDSCAVQGNLDPITLFAPEPILETRVRQVLERADGRPGHIFNLGHGIVPGTPVENVQAVVKMVKALSPKFVRKEIQVDTGNGPEVKLG